MVNNLLNSAYSPSTLLRYHRGIRRFTKFCVSTGLQINLPVDSHLVSLYIAHLSLQNLKASTIRTLLSPIGWYHKINSLPDPTQSFMVLRLLEGVKRSSTLPSNRVSPISLPVLHEVLYALPKVLSSPHDIAAYSALFLLSYYAALRACEVVKSGTSKHMITIDNVEVKSSPSGNSIIITLPSYKHSKSPAHLLLKESPPLGALFRPY